MEDQNPTNEQMLDTLADKMEDIAKELQAVDNLAKAVSDLGWHIAMPSNELELDYLVIGTEKRVQQLTKLLQSQGIDIS